MNINPIRSGGDLEVLSSLKSPKQSPHNKTDVLKSGNNNQQATESDKQSKTEQSKQLKTDKTEQSKQLINGSKLQDKQKEDEKETSSFADANKLVDELNEYMDELQTSLGFSVTKAPDNQVVFQIKDRKTNEVIKQIPSEEIQKIKEKMYELTGLLLDQKA